MNKIAQPSERKLTVSTKSELTTFKDYTEEKGISE